MYVTLRCGVVHRVIRGLGLNPGQINAHTVEQYGVLGTERVEAVWRTPVRVGPGVKSMRIRSSSTKY